MKKSRKVHPKLPIRSIKYDGTSKEYAEKILGIPLKGPELTGTAMADLWVQTAYRRSKGDGKKMKEILQEVHDFHLKHGGAFATDGTECHPHLPGCSKYMAQWADAFEEALRVHINLIRE